MSEITINHYTKVAKDFGLSGASTMKDQFIREAEVAFFLKEIKRFIENNHKSPTIMDLGCGNGYLLERIRENFEDLTLYGIELTPKLFELADSRKIPNCKIHQGDITSSIPRPTEIDILITERVVINLLHERQREKFLKTIPDLLAPGGLYLMCESFRENLFNLNRARKEFRLPKIHMPRHNQYIREKEIEILTESGMKEIAPALARNYLSTHFYLTRVLHPYLKPKNTRREQNEFVKFMCEGLGPSIGEYSPILFRTFTHRSGNLYELDT